MVRSLGLQCVRVAGRHTQREREENKGSLPQDNKVAAISTPTMPSTKREKRDRAIAELLSSETDYVSDLKVILVAGHIEREREKESVARFFPGWHDQQDQEEYNSQTRNQSISASVLSCRGRWAAAGCRPSMLSLAQHTRTHTQNCFAGTAPRFRTVSASLRTFCSPYATLASLCSHSATSSYPRANFFFRTSQEMDMFLDSISPLVLLQPRIDYSGTILQQRKACDRLKRRSLCLDHLEARAL